VVLHWDYSEITVGYIGVTLGLEWGYRGVALGLKWVTLGLHWDNSGDTSHAKCCAALI
jgi:hypothetical protein